MQALRSPEGKHALDYLRETRGLSDAVIDQFEMGYCPEHIDHELAGRIITPICDAYGEFVALSSRRMEKDHPSRFFHESFDKSFHLYGFHIAKPGMRKWNRCVVVEGEMDVAAMHTHGLDMTVGVCGSALSIFQIAMILRYAEEVYLLFDRDENQSGQRAIKRTMDLYGKYIKSSGYDADISFIPVYLPMGMDPDEFLLDHGRDAMIALFQDAKNRNRQG